MNQKILIRDTPEEVASLLRRLPLAFPAALNALMKWRAMTGEALAEAALISAATISRLRNDPDYETSIEIIVALCVGLRLPPALYYELLRLAGYSFKATERHAAYQQLLPQAYLPGMDMHQFNEALAEWHLPPIGQVG